MSWRAGPRSTLPVQTLNCAPCQGQVSTSPSSSPSLRGPLIWVQLSVKAYMDPSTFARQIGSPSTSTAMSSPSSKSLSSATFTKSDIDRPHYLYAHALNGDNSACDAVARG